MINKENLICHCCTTDKNIKLCELDNCNYPMCSNCRFKVFENNNLCPKCRRDITINQEIIVDDNIILDEGENLFFSCNLLFCNLDINQRNNRICTVIIKFKDYFIYLINLAKYPVYIILYLIVSTLLIFTGRFVTVVLKIGPESYWCNNIFLFISLGLLGIFIFFICILFFIFADICFNSDLTM